ncbi:MAG: sugar ABC transporter permease [Defluviitaleaceae bacterium]|nr:sugar ABC transporter permease [Defluviitaleaceae bacterium]
MVDSTFRENFVFLDNYAALIKNQYFLMALKNTFLFSITGVAAIMSLSLALSFRISRLGDRSAAIRNLLLLPMLLPTASIVLVWRAAFQNDFYTNLLRSSPAAGIWTVLPVFLIFIWKNTGLNVLILCAAISGIPREVREAAALDGATGARLHRRVTLPLISPCLLFVVVLSFVNTLKCYRESYLFFRTNYPPNAAYTVQYYMNNQFSKLNYPALTVASIIFAAIVVVIILLMYVAETRFNEKTN